MFSNGRIRIQAGFSFPPNLWSLLEVFPEKFGTIKIVILTTSVSPEDKNKALNISKDIIFLNKPLTKEALNQI